MVLARTTLARVLPLPKPELQTAYLVGAPDDSVYKSVKKAGLRMLSVVLEPIGSRLGRSLHLLNTWALAAG